LSTRPSLTLVSRARATADGAAARPSVLDGRIERARGDDDARRDATRAMASMG